MRIERMTREERDLLLEAINARAAVFDDLAAIDREVHSSRSQGWLNLRDRLNDLYYDISTTQTID